MTVHAFRHLFVIIAALAYILVCRASGDDIPRALKNGKGGKGGKGGKKPKSSKSSKSGKCKFSGSKGSLETFTFAVDLEAEGLCDDVTQEPDKSDLEQAICDYFNDSMDYQKCNDNAFVEVCSVADFIEASTCSRRNTRRKLLPSQAQMHISGQARPPSSAPDFPGLDSINGWRRQLGRPKAPNLLDYINKFFPDVTDVAFTDIDEIETCQSENKCEYYECNCVY